MYLLTLSFFNISALVALVPIPLPLICALSSSSSMSCPAFSIARIIEPELYLLGGEVSPSFISNPVNVISEPFFNSLRLSSNSASVLSDELSVTSFTFPVLSFESASCIFLFLANELFVTFR